jgi:hypothetical protein
MGDFLLTPVYKHRTRNPVCKRGVLYLGEHGQEKGEGKQKGKSDKRITESTKARQKETLHCAQT